MSVSEAQQKIDSAEFAEWVAYHNIEHFSFNKTENMLAIIAAILANTNRAKGVKAYSPEDFIPVYKTQKGTKKEGVNLETKLKAILNYHGNN